MPEKLNRRGMLAISPFLMSPDVVHLDENGEQLSNVPQLPETTADQRQFEHIVPAFNNRTGQWEWLEVSQ